MKPVTKQILVFIVLTVVFSAVPESLMLYLHRMDVGANFAVYAVMWCPALAAFVTCALFRVDIGTLGWHFRPLKYEWTGYLLPVLYALPVYVIAWLSIEGAFTYSIFAKTQAAEWGLPNAPIFATWGLAIPAFATIGVIRAISSAVGEEIGWRGFLLPRLAMRLGFTGACTASGLIWALWHYPSILWAGYDSQAPKWFALTSFTLMVISASFILGWLRLKSGSLWPCAVLHASHNLFIQRIFDGMTAQTGSVVYITGEFGVGMIATTAAAAIWLWSRRGELPCWRPNTALHRTAAGVLASGRG